MTTVAPDLQAIPLACDPSAIPDEARPGHAARAQRLFEQAVLERQDLADGLAFRVAAADYELVAAFVAQERRCCPFFRFAIEVAPNEGPIWLRITGAPGAKEVLAEGLRELMPIGGAR